MLLTEKQRIKFLRQLAFQFPYCNLFQTEKEVTYFPGLGVLWSIVLVFELNAFISLRWNLEAGLLKPDELAPTSGSHL